MARWRLEHLDLACHLRDLFRLLDVQCVFDVGANTGQYRTFLRSQVGYDGLIYSFEPIPALVEELRTQAQSDKQWEIFAFALGSEDGSQEINVMSTTQFSSFLKPDHENVRDFQERNVVDHSEPVSVRRLDSVMDEIAGTIEGRNIYLKMDTQGYDLQVLEGAQHSLPSISALQSEVSVRNIYAGMPDLFQSLDAFHKSGFDITGMFPVSRDKSLRVIEFDCVAINRSRL